MTTHRFHSWSRLRRLSQINDLPWAISGDFNEIRFSLERKVEVPSRYVLIDFQNVIDFCNHVDLQFVGYHFTWTNGRIGDNLVEKRLDYFLCNSK